MSLQTLIPYGYIAASVLFIFGLKMLSKATTARRGNLVSSLGMLLAIVLTLLVKGLSYEWIVVGAVVGSLIGAIAARMVKMTAMPELVGLFNGFGGLASLLVGWAEYHRMAALDGAGNATLFASIAIFLTIVIGGVTFSGSVIAWGKLSGKLGSKPVIFPG